MRSVAANCLIQEMGRTPTLNLWAAILWALGLFAFHSLGAEISLDSPSTALVTPAEDTNAVLHNPDMGWVLYENYPLDQDPHGSSTMLTLPDDDFPEVDSVALMFSWQDIEPREGIYDFSKVDHAYDYWRKRAKAIQLRLSTESLISWE
jgi:hypothetical protein